jgi:hypothetical protein
MTFARTTLDLRFGGGFGHHRASFDSLLQPGEISGGSRCR